MKIKDCPKCKKEISLKDILEDPEFVPIGISIDDEDYSLNFYYFNHKSENCNTTFAILVEAFNSVIKEIIPTKILTNTSVCNGYCTDVENKNNCPNACQWAPYLRFLVTLIESKINPQKV